MGCITHDLIGNIIGGFVITKALYPSELYELNAALNIALYLIVLVLLVEKGPQKGGEKDRHQLPHLQIISLSYKT